MWKTMGSSQRKAERRPSKMEVAVLSAPQPRSRMQSKWLPPQTQGILLMIVSIFHLLSDH